MGLDMYLYRRRYVQNWDHFGPEQKTEVTLTVGGKPVELTNPTYIIEQVGYWRKANEIHKFFCDLDEGKDECQDIYVELESLKELRDRCAAVLENHSLAEELLPTAAGFFFGSTDYDDWYFEDLKATIAILDPLLERKDTGDGYYYQASW